jgi:gamma-glutamylcyclotransferase (GGCT)/AIG2-like uncharacterized protein YtfP
MYSLHDHFFFYGILIPEYAPEHLREVLAGFHSLGEGSLPGTLYDFGNYPGAVFDEASPSHVFGRVYMGSSDDLLLAELDRYEGYDQLSPAEGEYIRKRRNVTLATGKVVECWMYDYNWSTTGFPIIADGRWQRE